MVHFIMDAVDALGLDAARVNESTTGSTRYPPSMMLGLLIYSYATGAFSSRRIERQAYENVHRYAPPSLPPPSVSLAG